MEAQVPRELYSKYIYLTTTLLHRRNMKISVILYTSYKCANHTNVTGYCIHYHILTYSESILEVNFHKQSPFIILLFESFCVESHDLSGKN